MQISIEEIAAQMVAISYDYDDTGAIFLKRSLAEDKNELGGWSFERNAAGNVLLTEHVYLDGETFEKAFAYAETHMAELINWR